jgi:hypothetical protein
VPVSKRCPNGSSDCGRTLYGRHRSATSRRTYAMPRCGPKNLYDAGVRKGSCGLGETVSLGEIYRTGS